MQVTFLNAAGTVLFVRDDMESGNWTQEEQLVTCTFPFDPNKVIAMGQRIMFRDPATNGLEVFEIKNVNNTEPDGAQQISCEGIVISELTDEHINNAEITDYTPAQALAQVLTGTLWSVGNSSVSNTNSVDISRGTVWQAVCAIKENWNVYITPRLTFSTAGAITGRYLDITPAQGTWRGVRLSIDKNMLDSSVTYDDSEVYTALYGYGGNVDVPQAQGDDETVELTFADVVWTATAEHPAKPAGQTYLEDPAKTAIYGRNGRPRYGFYQNSDITDANILLEKTWESLKLSSNPTISISGSVVDLYRLGYHDEPLRLHDIALVEIRQTGEVFQKEIIRLDVDLVDPSATRPEIGDYIPNIVYINRATNDAATGGGGGGGGGGRGSMTKREDEDSKYRSEFIKTEKAIGLVVGTHDGEGYIKAASIVASINDDGGTNIKLTADTIDINGVVQALEALTVTVSYLNVTNGIDCGDIQCGNIDGDTISANGDLRANGDLDIGGNATIDGTTITLNGSAATWQTKQISTPTYGSRQYFLYAASSGSTTPTGTTRHYPITGHSESTIHYLGGADT